MLDSNLILLASGATTATRTGSWIDLGKGGTRDRALAIRVTGSITPTGTTPQLTPKFEFSDNSGGTPVTETQTEPTETTRVQRTYQIRTRWRYVRVTLTVAGTTPDFGNTEVVASTGMPGREFNIKNA